MKALENIQNEAKQIVEQLADRQINNMKERYNKFLEWMNIEGNVIIANYTDRVDMYQTAHKYIFMTQYKKYNHEIWVNLNYQLLTLVITVVKGKWIIIRT
jgi:hypothetical protein